MEQGGQSGVGLCFLPQRHTQRITLSGASISEGTRTVGFKAARNVSRLRAVSTLWLEEHSGCTRIKLHIGGDALASPSWNAGASISALAAGGQRGEAGGGVACQREEASRNGPRTGLPVYAQVKHKRAPGSPAAHQHAASWPVPHSPAVMRGRKCRHANGLREVGVQQRAI